MNKSHNQIAGAINRYKLNIKCRDFNEESFLCFEEIYKVTYSYWHKCHNTYRKTLKDDDGNDAEFKFMVDITEIVEILRPLFMVDVANLSTDWLTKLGKKRRYVSGSLPSPMYFNFLLHTARFKVCRGGLSDSFKKFIEILFMSSFEENNITGIIPLDITNESENEVYQLKINNGSNRENTISNSDIISMVQNC